MPQITVHPVNVMADSIWSWSTQQPTWRHRNGYGATATFDPFPAYPHDLATVERAAAYVAERVPLTWDVEIYVADREEIARSNGFSALADTGRYVGEEWVKDPTVGMVMLSGKRVPPHPAMTRYLVAHELGHHMEWMLNVPRGGKVPQGRNILHDYAKLRGLDSTHAGSGGRWHDSVDEVFACDFRILVCDVEVEFWPHPGVPRPEGVAADLRGWWTESIEMLRATATEPATTAA